MVYTLGTTFFVYFFFHESGMLASLIKDFRLVLEYFEMKHFHKIACNSRITRLVSAN